MYLGAWMARVGDVVCIEMHYGHLAAVVHLEQGFMVGSDRIFCLK